MRLASRGVSPAFGHRADLLKHERVEIRCLCYKASSQYGHRQNRKGGKIHNLEKN
jgi:hypothetical protein